MKPFFFFAAAALLLAACNGKPHTGHQPVLAVKDTAVARTQPPQQKLLHRDVCSYTQLSRSYDYAIAVDIDSSDDGEFVTKIYVTLTRKADKQVQQQIVFEPENISGMFTYTCSSRSYITGYNRNKEVVDGLYGDLITDDYNFDGREDFAVATSKGFAEFYSFFIQDSTGRFAADTMLTNNMRGLPATNASLQTLTTRNIHGVEGIETQVWQFNPGTKNYSLTQNEVRNVNTGELMPDPFAADADTTAEAQ